jgi:hypothetical protein
VRTQLTLALIALLTSGAASADDFSFRNGGLRTAALYLEVPVGVRDRAHAKPAFGLRLQQDRLPLASVGRVGGGTKTLLDVPLLVRKDDPLRASGAQDLLGKGAIVGIVVGAVVAVAVISDDGDGGGY